jgi:molybdopterin molybdotransferase
VLRSRAADNYPKVMIELKQALQIVREAARPLGNERVDMSDALNRILAEDVTADMDMPPFDKAVVDGYACRRGDLANTLAVVETIPAGAVPVKTIGSNQCAKIMTGAVVPPGADCVIMVELTQILGSNGIRFTGGQTRDNICRRAEDIRRGQIVLRKGSRMGPQEIAVLASVGHVQPLVARRPTVAVIASGDELVAPAERPGSSQIRNSNSPQLAAQLRSMGVIARDYGIVKDTEADIDNALKAALAEEHVVIISGGVSAGDFDFVPAVLRRNNVTLLFEKIAVKPGKPTVFGQSEQGYCFGLPGNPVSTFVMFELLVKPFLYRLMGHDYSPVTCQMTLDEPITRRDAERQGWIPVKLTSGTTVRPVEYHGSGHIFALCQADGLISMEIGVARIEKAAPISVGLLSRSGS